jgi:ABC-type transport system involved in cytochrome c biogenesis ATPase subunit
VTAFLDDEGMLLDPHEEAVLVEACRIADRLAQLRAALADADLSDVAAVRLLSEERQQRVALSTLLISRLGLPTGLVGEPVTPRSRRAQKAAQTRWQNHTKRGA